VDGPKVYADLTFLINFIMDFVILWATARMAGTRVILFRLTAAAILGAIYSVIYLFPAMASWYSFPAKILMSFLIVYVGLAPRNWLQFKKGLFFFYAMCFVVAGASIAVSCLAASPEQGFNFSWLWLAAGAMFAVVLGVYGEKHLLRKIVPDLLKFGVELKFGTRSCNGQGFLDTGNGLRDPLTNRPVVVAEYELIRKCLPEDFKQVMEDFQNENDILDGLSKSSWANRLRIIPFSSIGRKNGILVGIRADAVLVNNGKSGVAHNNIVVGIYKEKLSQDGSYQMLIPSEIMNG